MTDQEKHFEENKEHSKISLGVLDLIGTLLVKEEKSS